MFLAVAIGLMSMTPAPVSNDLAGTRTEADPLFQSDELLAVRLQVPLKRLMRERPDEDELPGELSWTEADGRTVSVSVKVRTRGNYRRQDDVCPFAPLRLNLRKSEVKDSLFDNQDKLKMVTHCKNNSRRYQEGLFREYAAYRIFNLLSDTSFRVRMLKVTYVDTESADNSEVAYAFLIEHSERFAKRTGLPEIKVPRTSVARLEPAYTNLVSVFQYLIGNTDYSPIAGARDSDCCHNTSLFGVEDGQIYAVPYDFDMSGLVDSKYASPNPKFNIRTVRQRLYRGRCLNNEHLPQSLQLLADKRTAIDYMVATLPEQDARTAKSLHSYIDSYYRRSNDVAEAAADLAGNCIK